MHTHGYERSAPWRQALNLLGHVRSLTDAFDDDPLGQAGKLRALAADLPMLAALTFEQLDYDAAKSHAANANAQLFKLHVQCQVAAHLGLLSHKQVKELHRRIDTLDAAFTALPDELFEDDGLAPDAAAA